jgi:hypothetical protein
MPLAKSFAYNALSVSFTVAGWACVAVTTLCWRAAGATADRATAVLWEKMP